MKSIATVNTAIPTVDDRFHYLDGQSLRDFDIAVFSPQLPELDREYFSGGGSCLSIEAMKSLSLAIRHWRDELRGALAAGKTVFVLLSEYEQDQGATGSSMKTPKERIYSTSSFNNYSVIPADIQVRNTKGRKIRTVDTRFKVLMDALGDMMSYQVIVTAGAGAPICTTSDGATVGALYGQSQLPGHLVFVPFFDFLKSDTSTDDTWSKKSIQTSKAVVSQLVAIDKMLTQESDATPEPDWLLAVNRPREINLIDERVAGIDKAIAELVAQKETELAGRRELSSYARLLYENGKPLESAIENGLRVLGYDVSQFQSGDLEIDHVFSGPSGTRMIGESEGKDTTAIDITKFRQLESNINEDFERPEISLHAKGVLFGNGYRLRAPADRGEQFTSKCLTNAKRLGTALVQTSDLYQAVVYLIDNPEDKPFREACRAAIEEAEGTIVKFPTPGK